MKNILFIVMFMALLSACTSVPENGDKRLNCSETPVPPNKLAYSGFPDFDEKLTCALRHQDGPVVVSLEKSINYEAGGMHPPLTYWLAFVEESGGKISREYYPDRLGAGLVVVPVVVGVIAFYQEIIAQRRERQEEEKKKMKEYLVSSYDVRLCSYEGKSENDYSVDKVVFVYRGLSPEIPVCADI